MNSNHLPDDHGVTLADLRQQVRQFVSDRGWERYHSPKNLCMALSVEVAELAEHFQWKTPEESKAVTGTAELEAIGEEIADVFCYVLALANELNLDLSSAFRDKMAKNERKYPADEWRGRDYEKKRG